MCRSSRAGVGRQGPVRATDAHLPPRRSQAGKAAGGPDRRGPLEQADHGSHVCSKEAKGTGTKEDRGGGFGTEKKMLCRDRG